MQIVADGIAGINAGGGLVPRLNAYDSRIRESLPTKALLADVILA